MNSSVLLVIGLCFAPQQIQYPKAGVKKKNVSKRLENPQQKRVNSVI